MANPDAPAVAQWSASQSTEPQPTTPTASPQTVGASWVGTHASESIYVPPDAIGAVGLTQVLITSNGRFKVFDKTGTVGGLNVADYTFFASVEAYPGSYCPGDPQVRYDRLSSRWFITEIEFCYPYRILIAVSSGSIITDSSSFTFFQFQHDLVGPTPNADTGGFPDYDSMAVDANAVYIGVNVFDSNYYYFNSSVFVLNKAALIGGTLKVTPFRGLVDYSSYNGPMSPRAVFNDDPAATEGYVIGVDFGYFGLLTMRRIVNPGGTPSISGNLLVSVPSTYYPAHFSQEAVGSDAPLDAIDDRLYSAMIKKNKITGVSSLWTAHSFAVNSSGAVSGTVDRNASRWYQIGSLTTTPTLVQSGTLFDPTGSRKGYWIPSIAASGQGHMAIVASVGSSLLDYAGIAVAGRLSGDSPGSTGSPTLVISGAYNDSCIFCLPYRWGDYSMMTVDPNDDQTMWAFAEQPYTSTPTDAWAVRAIKLVAPPPATPSSASPASINACLANITITGTSISGSGFFDPGPGFANHIAAAITGGVSVNSVTFVNPTTVTLNISAVSATLGAKDVTITNPDGQQTTGSSLFSVTGNTTCTRLVPGDFDGDKKADPSVFRPSDGTWRILTSNSGYTGSSTYTLGDSTYMPVSGDYDGDGLADVAVWQPSTGTWKILTSSSGYTAMSTYTWGVIGDIAVPGDYDGDGKTDLAVYRPSTGTWWILKSSTSFATFKSMTWGMSGDIPVPGDYDGDLRTDIAVYRPSTGTWWILKSSGGSFSVSWGVGTDKPVTGDFDGDGKTDLGVFRPSTGSWWILKSSTNFSGAYLSVSYGVSTDVLVPSDYDGDGKTDVAVFRPSDHTFRIVTSRSGFDTASPVIYDWGAGTDIPVLKRPGS